MLLIDSTCGAAHAEARAFQHFARSSKELAESLRRTLNTVHLSLEALPESPFPDSDPGRWSMMRTELPGKHCGGKEDLTTGGPSLQLRVFCPGLQYDG